MQQRRFYLKLVSIAFIMLLLFIPQVFLLDLVTERVGWREQAYQSIGQSWPGEQTIAGPVLILPYQRTYLNKEIVKDDDGKTREVARELMDNSALYLIPSKLAIQSNLDSSVRYRGIYQVPVYTNQLQVQGEFNTQTVIEFLKQNADNKIRWQAPYVAVMLRDQRGIARPPSLQWLDSTVAFQPGSELPGANTAAGMHAKLPALSLDQATTLTFAFNLELNGMRAMNFALLAEESTVKTSANWPSPSFNGELLPVSREINAQGFSATWQASSFSFNVSAALDQCKKGECGGLLDRAVGFSLMQPVDSYQQAERSVKYAILFIVLTFGVLILFELLKKLRIHPVQYTLVGFALLVFYLLLISLSEHLAFNWAYIAAAFASTALLTVYFSAILHNRRLGLLLGSGLILLYALLYGILQAEDNALLMGSVLIFTVLALLMLTTRHFDWYALTSGSAQNLQNNSAVSPHNVDSTCITPE